MISQSLTIALLSLLCGALFAGLGAGVICRRIGGSLMIGYMLAGTIIGEGGVGLLGHESDALEDVATFGALLLLFSVGIEFSVSSSFSVIRLLLMQVPPH